MGSLNEGTAWAGLGLRVCCCQQLRMLSDGGGTPEKREPLPRGLRVGGLWTVIREVTCSGAGCQGALGNLWE